VAASGLRLSGEQKRMWRGPHQTGSRHVPAPDPAWVLFKVQVCSVLGPWGPFVGGPDPIPGGSRSHSRGPACTRGGPGPTLGVRTVYLGFRDQPVGVRTTVDALEYITFSRHMAALDPPTWLSRALLWTQSSRLGPWTHGLVPHTAHLPHD
jgi:hypothetical protein